MVRGLTKNGKEMIYVPCGKVTRASMGMSWKIMRAKTKWGVHKGDDGTTTFKILLLLARM